GPLAGWNPWKATGLEWQTPSPPPTLNFDRTPIVTRAPYAYSPEADDREATEQEVRRAELEAGLRRQEIERSLAAAEREEAERGG
ncbi:MAG: hypothetical protein FJX77_15210, partial [Armatimonadetes bacterium]|nr:hypothetical protein [Armatimonadota bacterium]